MAETIHYPEVNRNAVFSDNFDFNVAPCQAKRQITEHMGSSKQLGRNYCEGTECRPGKIVIERQQASRSVMAYPPLPNPKNALKIHSFKVFFIKINAIPKKTGYERR